MVIERAEIVFWGYFKYKDHLNAFLKLYGVCCDAVDTDSVCVYVCVQSTNDIYIGVFTVDLVRKIRFVNWNVALLGYVARWAWKAEADKREFFERLIVWTTAYAFLDIWYTYEMKFIAFQILGWVMVH